MSEFKTCPYCESEIQAKAVKCKLCKKWVGEAKEVVKTGEIKGETGPVKIEPNNKTKPNNRSKLIWALVVAVALLFLLIFPETTGLVLIILAIPGFIITLIVIIIKLVLKRQIQTNNLFLLPVCFATFVLGLVAFSIATLDFTDYIQDAASGTNDDSAKTYQEVSDSQKEMASQLIRDAREHLDIGNWERAEELLMQAEDINPHNPQIEYYYEEVDQLIAKEFEKEFRGSCREYEYRVIDKDAEILKGERIVLKGQVVQIMESSGIATIRLAVTKQSYGWSVSDIVYVTHLGETNIYRDDVITVYGTIEGFHTYTSAAGYNITLPYIWSSYYDK